MKTWKINLAKLISFIMVISLFSGITTVKAVSANSYINGGINIVDYYEGGTLETVVADLTTEYEEITGQRMLYWLYMMQVSFKDIQTDHLSQTTRLQELKL